MRNENRSPLIDIFKVDSFDGLSTLQFLAGVKVYTGLLFALKIVINNITAKVNLSISDSKVIDALEIAETGQNIAFISIFDERFKLKLGQKLLLERYVAVGQLIGSLEYEQTVEWFKSEQNIEDFSLSTRENGENARDVFYYRLDRIIKDSNYKGLMRYLIEGIHTNGTADVSRIKRMMDFLLILVREVRSIYKKIPVIDINEPDPVDGMSVIHDISKAAWMQTDQLNIILTTLHAQRNVPDLSVRTIDTQKKTPIQLAEECDNVAFLSFYGIDWKVIPGKENKRLKKMMLDTLNRIDNLIQESKQQCR
jgi:hypothetical protein